MIHSSDQSIFLTIDKQPVPNIPAPAPYEPPRLTAANVAAIITHLNPDLRQQVSSLLLASPSANRTVSDSEEIVSLIAQEVQSKNAALRRTLEQREQEKIANEKRRLCQIAYRSTVRLCCITSTIFMIGCFFAVTKHTCYTD